MRTSLSLVLVSLTACSSPKNEGLSTVGADGSAAATPDAATESDLAAPRRGNGGGPVVGCAEALSPCPPVSTGFTCVDLANDPKNCGGCGITCGAKMFCATGKCRCPGEARACGSACTNVPTD